MTTVVFPGSFDPITAGHLDIVVRARQLFDTVIVAVAHNSQKVPLLSAERRIELASQALAHLTGVTVQGTDGLLADFCESVGAVAIVKGLRGGADYDIERPMALMNRAISGIETVFVTGDPALAHVASSLVKDVARHGGDIAAFVPAPVEAAVLEALRERA